MTQETVVNVLKKKLEIAGSLRDRSYEDQEFKIWRDQVKHTIKAIYGEKSGELQDWEQISYIAHFIDPDPWQEREGFQHGMDNAVAHLSGLIDTVETFGLPSRIRDAAKDIPKTTSFVQNFNLSQSQVQSVSNEIDIAHLDPDVAEKVNTLLAELSKKSG